MPHNFQFNYRITEEKLSKLTVEGSQRQEKNLASLQMGFDKQLKDKHSGNAVLVFKASLIRGLHTAKPWKDIEVLVRLQADFHCDTVVPETTDAEAESDFWFPLVSDLYLLAQDRARRLCSETLPIVFPTPLSREAFAATLPKHR